MLLMVTLTQRLPENADAKVSHTLLLTSDERTRSNYRYQTEKGEVLLLRLPRGTMLRDRDLLRSENGSAIRCRRISG